MQYGDALTNFLMDCCPEAQEERPEIATMLHVCNWLLQGRKIFDLLLTFTR
ncbi:hypothetical protein SAMN02927924_03618 [Sphingobium faniae]|nr:hypothetical protein SAMN02927924_03618 [Sphingobium faniae]